MAVGQSLGGPWTVIAPAAGFGIGFLADMKLMKGMHGKKAQPQQPAPAQAASDAQPALVVPPGDGKPPYPIQDLGKV
jgi:hypothetical protein